MASPTPAASLISLNTVSAEIQFISDFIDDLGTQTASPADKQRIKDLLAAAQADLAIAAHRALVNLGQNPNIGDNPPPPNG
jgi:hypothetical protein